MATEREHIRVCSSIPSRLSCFWWALPLHDVAMLLGHKSIKTTEKHYAPFVMARMEQLDASVKAAWVTKPSEAGDLTK